MKIMDLPCASVSKRAFVQNVSYKNMFDLDENEVVGETHFRSKWFRTQICFDTEVTDNWEMIYSLPKQIFGTMGQASDHLRTD